jgi:phosphoribosyl 1,2-cyclic phosphodiesterase
MSLELCILASGSLGNCSVVRAPAPAPAPAGGVMLIDAGIGPRVTARRMNGTGVSVRDVRAICLTHLDSDHFRPSWLGTIVRCGIRVWCHESRRDDLLRGAIDDAADSAEQRKFRALVHTFNGEPFAPLEGLSVRSISLAHDRSGSHAFLIDGFGARIGYATDLGHVPRELIDGFCDVHVLAIESNYDPGMQLTSGRPCFLKRRIMGGRGHLSNGQALELIRAVLDRCQRRKQRLPEHIVLLHRSRECNCPRLVRRVFAQDQRIAPRLTLGEQFQRTEWIRPRAVPPHVGEQLTLAW